MSYPVLQEIQKICTDAQGNWANADLQDSPKIFHPYKNILELIEKHFSNKNEKIIQYKTLVLNLESFEAIFEGQIITLKRRQFHLIWFFFKNPNKVFTREELLYKVWTEDNANVLDRTIDVHIAQIKEKLPVLKMPIKSIRGVGYKFIN